MYEKGLAYTILRNDQYAEVTPMFVGENVFETGIYLPTGYGTPVFCTEKRNGRDRGQCITSQ